MTQLPTIETQFVICIHNVDYPAALELRKIYQVVQDEVAFKQRLMRVIDESGEDYLYPDTYFLALDLPQAIKEVLLHAA